jgi:hypothetical protein
MAGKTLRIMRLMWLRSHWNEGNEEHSNEYSERELGEGCKEDSQVECFTVIITPSNALSFSLYASLYWLYYRIYYMYLYTHVFFTYPL